MILEIYLHHVYDNPLIRKVEDMNDMINKIKEIGEERINRIVILDLQSEEYKKKEGTKLNY